MTRVGFLGPHGTFAEEALLTQPDLAAGEAVPFRDVPHVITAVEHGDVDLGIVPIENSIEGSITVTLDTLAFDTELLVQREVDLPVSLNLCAPPGTKIVRHHHRRVAPEPARPDPDVDGEAPARRRPRSPPTPPPRRPSQVAKSRQAGHGVDRHRARARSNAGLEILASEIEDHPENQTRFVIVGYGIPAPTGHDKTSIVCFQRQDRPGSLLAILQEFAARAINLTKLESRPTKREPRRLLLLHRLRGPPRRRARRRLPAQPRGEAGQGEVPRLVPRRRATTATSAGKAVTKAWRDATTWLDGLRDQIRGERHRRDRPQAAARRARLPRRASSASGSRPV